MPPKTPPRALGATLACALFPAVASASIISINFEGGRINPCCGGPGTADVTGTAGFVPAPNWNNFSGNSGSNLTLVDDSGSASGATLNYSAPNNWASASAAPDDGASGDLMSGYLDNLHNGGSITVSNLGASFTSGGYDVIVYFNADSGGTQGFTLGGTSRYGRQTGGAGSNYPLGGGSNGFVVSEATSPGSAPGANAIRFPGLSGSSFTITGVAGGGGDRPRPNGIQIIGTDIPGLATVENDPASGVTGTTATLRGEVTDVGDGAPEVTIFYGTGDGGFAPGDWDTSIIVPGTHAGTFSASVSGLSPATAYFFRARATNSAGAAWAATAETFETAPDPPSVITLAPDEVTATTAEVGAQVTATGGDTPVVTIHYGTVDAGTAAWQNTAPLGSQPGLATTVLSGLAPGTVYFYRASATNGGGTTWAPSGDMFTTGSVGPAAVENRPAASVTGTTANLRGEVTETGFDPPSVTLYFGTSDGGTVAGNWDTSIALGTREGNFSTFQTGLLPETPYYYRAAATNIAGTVWAPSTETFNTTALVPDTVLINEVHYDPSGVENEEFVELHNPGDSAVDLSGWTIGGAIDYTFPGGTTIPLGGYLVVAADPSVIQSNYSVAALGPFAGKLSNEGERIELSNATGTRVDEVDYGVGFPWPTASNGGGASMELMHPSLDNDLAGSWRASGSEVEPPAPATFVPAGSTGWSWRRGTSEASNPQSAWRQVGFVEDASWNAAPLGTPIGYNDGDDVTVITGMQGVHWSIYLRHEFEIDPDDIPSALLVRGYVDDGCVIWINGTEVARFSYNDGPTNYDTPANNHEARWEETVVTNAGAFLNGGTNVIAVLAANSSFGSSDFSIDAELKTPDGVSSSGTPTPGAPNSVLSATDSIPPQVRQVDHSPNEPASGQSVVISARITDPDGVGPVNLHYQVVEPGAYIRRTDAAYENPANWTTLAMNDDGLAGDAVAGDSTYSATVPAAVQLHRRLVRYRITAEDGNAVAVDPPYADDEQPNFAYFVYDGIPAWSGASNPAVGPVNTFTPDLLDDFPTYHLIADGTDVTNSQYSGGSDGVHMLGTMVYDGEVYDHMEFENRGEASTYQSGKNKWRFHFNRAREFEARDDWGKRYQSGWDEMNFDACASPWAPVHRGMAGVEEVVSYRLYALCGMASPRTHYVHFRIVDAASETGATQYDSDLWGLYTAIEHPDGSYLDDRDLPDGNVYKIEGGNGDKKHQAKNGQPTNSSDWNTFRSQSGSTQNESYWRSNMNLPAYYTFRAGNRLLGNVDVREGYNHYFYNNPVDGWTVMPWDLDMMFIAETHWSGTIQQKACLNVSTLALEYRNRAREMHDLLCTDPSPTGGQMAQLIEEYARMVNPPGQSLTWSDVDEAMWNYHPRTRGNPNSHSGQGNHKGNWFYTPFTDSRRGGSYVRTLISSDHEGSMNYLTEYVTDTFGGGTWSPGNGQQRGYGYEFLLRDAQDNAIPDKPTIDYTGAAGFPTDDLTFSNSSFSDPGGDGTFAALKWRVGEISNPGTPLYDPAETYKYEVEDHWDSGEITTFSSEFTVPPRAVRVGHTYRVRVKYKDNTGRWSHWSDPVEFAAGEPDLSPWQNDLMITELMYHPADATPAEQAAGFTNSDFEFVELQNVGAGTLDLTELRFTKGIDFDFVDGSITSLAPGAYVIIARDVAAFESRYEPGLPVAGEYRPDNLSNGGENVKLSFGLGSAIHEFEYDDRAPWPEFADGTGASMVLIDPASRPDHSLPTSWRASADNGNPGASDAVAFTGNPAADDDSDGLSALVEHAFGTSDGDPGDRNSLQVALDPGGHMTVTFPRSLAADDVSVSVQKSSDFVTWIDDPTIVLESNIAQGDGTSLKTWRLPMPVAADERCFVRVFVQEIP